MQTRHKHNMGRPTHLKLYARSNLSLRSERRTHAEACGLQMHPTIRTASNHTGHA